MVLYYATRYPKVIQLRNTYSKAIAQEQFQGNPGLTLPSHAKAGTRILGYYQRFVLNFAVPLTDFMRGKKLVMVQLKYVADQAFTELTNALCQSPMLVAPDFSSEFLVQTDVKVLVLFCSRRSMVRNPLCFFLA